MHKILKTWRENDQQAENILEVQVHREVQSRTIGRRHSHGRVYVGEGPPD